KLHCVRQAFEGLLEDKSNQLFFGKVGRQMVTGLMTKAEKSPKGFLESYEEMLSYALRPETWATTRLELEGRGPPVPALPQAKAEGGMASAIPVAQQSREDVSPTRVLMPWTPASVSPSGKWP
ncbi:MIGA2 isoform 6, partial [Pongo abelii]